MLCWPIILVSYASSPTLETRSHLSAPREDNSSWNVHGDLYMQLFDTISTLQRHAFALQIALFYLLRVSHPPYTSRNLCHWKGPLDIVVQISK